MNKIIDKTLMPLAALALALVGVSCTNIITQPPQDAFTDEDFWQSESSVRTYAWANYNTFVGYGSGVGTTAEFYWHGKAPTSTCMNIDDNLCQIEFVEYIVNPYTTNTDWNSFYTLIRRANLMLERVPNVSMAETMKNHYLGVAKFFRSYTYFRLVQRFGDVPYTEKYLAANDPEVYSPRTSRNEVMDRAIADMKSAAALMLPVDDKNVTVNKYTALAALSRMCIYEGTYRKYHQNGNGSQLFADAKAAALEVMTNGGYNLNTSWKALYNSVELSGNGEAILTRRYLPNILMSAIVAYTNSTTIQNGMTKFAAESYVTKNGLPIKQAGNTQYQGDDTNDNFFANRDSRLTETIRKEAYAYATKPAMNPATGAQNIKSTTGYFFYQFNNPAQSGNEVSQDGQNHIDAPVFAYNEVLLNYAEACAELGTITTADLDLSVNLLRDRAGVKRLSVSGTDAQVDGVTINDPMRTTALEQISGAVSPILWEIRRERRVELMSWTYIRYYDLMRWKKGDYLDFTNNPDVALGARVPSLIGSTGSTKVDANGYIIPYPVTSKRVFNPEKHYLNSIPTNDITLYKAEGVELTQNPKW